MTEPGESWWLSQPCDLPQQGDVLSLYPLSRVLFPPRALDKRTIKGGASAWVETDGALDATKEHHALAKGKHFHALVLSHDCEMDKERAKRRIHIAPISPLSRLPENEQRSTLAQKTLRHLPLPGIPDLGDFYADLLAMLVIDYGILDRCTRLASMSPPGVERLQAQLVAFFTRRDFTQVLATAPLLPE